MTNQNLFPIAWLSFHTLSPCRLGDRRKTTEPRGKYSHKGQGQTPGSGFILVRKGKVTYIGWGTETGGWIKSNKCQVRFLNSSLDHDSLKQQIWT